MRSVVAFVCFSMVWRVVVHFSRCAGSGVDQGGGDGGIVTGASLFSILLAHSYFNSPGVRCCVLLRPALPRSLFAIVLQALEINVACPAAP